MSRDFFSIHVISRICKKQILTKFRQLPSTKKRIVAHQKRRLDFQITVLGGVQVEHELAERALEPGKLALEHGEPRARQFRRRLEIHQAERLADLEMLLRRIGAFRLADASDLDIVGLVGANGHVVVRQVGQRGQPVEQRLVEPALLCLAVLDETLDIGDLGLEFFGQRQVLLRHRLADFPGGGVAAFLLGLQFGQMGTPRLVRGHHGVDLGARIRRRPATLFKRCGQNVGVVANPSDVEHGENRFP